MTTKQILYDMYDNIIFAHEVCHELFGCGVVKWNDSAQDFDRDSASDLFLMEDFMGPRD